MKLKVKLLSDLIDARRGKLRAGDEFVIDQDSYISWYYEIGRTVAHDVMEVGSTSGN